MAWVLACVIAVPLLVIAVVGYLFAAQADELVRRGEEIARLRRKLEHHLANDARLIDELWKRAQMEMARAERSDLRP